MSYLLKPNHGRAKLTEAQKRAQLNRKCDEQKMLCYYCGKLMTREPDRMNTATRDHRIPEKMGCQKDDSDGNIVVACWKCNMEKGSRRMPSWRS